MTRADFLKGSGALLAAVGAGTGVQAAAGEAKKRDAVVYVACHPDDLAGSIGTVMKLAETYEVHVVDFTHGERGLGEAKLLDGSCKKLRTAEEEAICQEIGVPLHWCEEVNGKAFAGREACERMAEIFREVKPRAIIVHAFMDTHSEHMMSSAAAIKGAEMAGIKPEIYFQEQDLQSRGFMPVYYVDVTPYLERRRKLITMYKSQWGDKIAERKIMTSRTNALRIWGNCGRQAEVFGVYPGTIRNGRGIFDEIEGVSR